MLPGVTVILQGVDATREMATGTDGSFRFGPEYFMGAAD